MINTGPISYEPDTANPKAALPEAEIIEQKLRELVGNAANKITRELATATLDACELRAHEIIEGAQLLAASQSVVMAIRINDEAPRKLKTAAHPDLDRVLTTLKVGLTPLLVGPAGCGKTFIGEQTAQALGLNYGHLCFSVGVSETWLFGRQTPIGFQEGEFSRLYREGGVFLADELDAADPNLLLTINTALANDHLYNPISGINSKRHPDFHFIGTANTYGKGGSGIYTGRNRLDAATLDRFTTIEIDYHEKVEKILCPDMKLMGWLRGIRQQVSKRTAPEIVSYRMFDRAYRLKQVGLSREEIEATLFAAWPVTLRKEVLKNQDAKF